MVTINFKTAALCLAVLLLSSCDARDSSLSKAKVSDRFGVSYDDCILRGLTAGLSNEAVGLIRQACVHVWEKTSETSALVEATLIAGPNAPRLSFEIDNASNDIATRVQIGIEFKTLPKSEKLYWSYPINLEPGQSIHLEGTFAGGKVPSQNFSVIQSDTQFIRVLPIKKAEPSTEGNSS